MKKITLAFAVLFIGSGPMTVEAIPVLYDTTYTATLGPSGTGSFIYDDTAGVISSFFWDFGGGIVGGLPDLGAVEIGGGLGRLGDFIFEILSETDVFPGADCVNGFCSFTLNSAVVGAAPFGATSFGVEATSAPGSSHYLFGPAETGVISAEGAISIARADVEVPEPATLLLLAAGFAGVALARRRRA